MRWLARSVDALPAGDGWLTPAEAARAAALRFVKRRTEYVLRRLVAKQAVAALTGMAGGRGSDPTMLARIEIANDAAGAPYALVDGVRAGVSVSLADRAGWAVCLVAGETAEVGCDLELVEPRSAAFQRDFLTDAERALVAACAPGDAQDESANLIWSAKESALKVLRTGLRRDTREVEVTRHPAGSDGWGTLRMTISDGPPLSGWWRRDGVFVFTVAAAEPGPPPVALEEPDALAVARPRPTGP